MMVSPVSVMISDDGYITEWYFTDDYINDPVSIMAWIKNGNIYDGYIKNAYVGTGYQ